MTDTPELGIVTVLYNSQEVLPGFFESLAAQNYRDFRLYAIDNSPSDESLQATVKLAKAHGIDLVTVRNSSNLGVASGNNQGIRRALDDGCRYVLLANNDIEFAPTTLTDILSPVKTGGRRVVVPKIYAYGTRKLWYAGGYFSSLRGGINIHRGYYQEDNGDFDEPTFCSYAPTCFMLLEASVFNEVGLMDDAYFVYWDDADFCYRLNRHAIQMYYLPSVVVNHKVSSSTGGESEFSLFYLNRNRLYFIRKNYEGAFRFACLAYFYIRFAIVFFLQPKKWRIILSALLASRRMTPMSVGR